VQAISPAQAAMITRPSRILPQYPFNTSSHSHLFVSQAACRRRMT
jgi:hypothetical protein